MTSRASADDVEVGVDELVDINGVTLSKDQVFEVVLDSLGGVCSENLDHGGRVEFGRAAFFISEYLNAELGVAVRKPKAVFLHQGLIADLLQVVADALLAIQELAAVIPLPLDYTLPSGQHLACHLAALV